MTNNHFEKRIQEKLNQFEIEPSENLLENIFEKRAARSKGLLKFSYFKLGVAALSLILVSTAIGVYWQSSNNNITLSNASKGVSNSTAHRSGQLKNEQIDKENNSASVNSKDADNLAGIEASEKFKSSEKTNKKLTNSLKIDADYSNSKQSNQRHKGLVESENIKKGTNSKQYTNIIHSNGSSKIDQQDYHDNGNNIEERYFNIEASNKPLIASVSHQGRSHLMVYHSVNRERLDNLNLNYLFLKPLIISREMSENDKVAMIIYESIHSQVKVRKPIFVDVLFTPMLSFHKVNGYDNANSDYTSLPTSSYNKQYSARVSYLISKNVGLFTGLGYMQLSTAFEGEVSKSESVESYETITNYINDPIKGPIAFNTIDTFNSTKTTQVNYNFKNTYDILSIPVGLNYNFGYRNFDFAINGSALMNFYTHAKGSNADFVNYQTTAFNSDKKQFGIGGGISFMTAYKLTNKFKLVVEPNLQYFKINSQLNGNVVNEKILNSGLSIGLRYTVF